MEVFKLLNKVTTILKKEGIRKLNQAEIKQKVGDEKELEILEIRSYKVKKTKNQTNPQRKLLSWQKLLRDSLTQEDKEINSTKEQLIHG